MLECGVSTRKSYKNMFDAKQISSGKATTSLHVNLEKLFVTSRGFYYRKTLVYIKRRKSAIRVIKVSTNETEKNWKLCPLY